MGAIGDLWKSERGLISVALIIAATVLSALGMLTVQQWLDYTKWIFVTYAAAKTITGSVLLAGAAADARKAKSMLSVDQLLSLASTIFRRDAPAAPEDPNVRPPIAIVPPEPPRAA